MPKPKITTDTGPTGLTRTTLIFADGTRVRVQEGQGGGTTTKVTTTAGKEASIQSDSNGKLKITGEPPKEDPKDDDLTDEKK